MKILRHFAAALGLAALTLLPLAGAEAAGAIGAPALRARHTTLGPQLADNAFGGPLVLQSQEVSRRIDGDVYAVLDHPFATVSGALSDPAQWCDILILHLNTKYCRAMPGEGGGTMLQVRVGKKEEQSLQSATLLRFQWRPATLHPDYISVDMDTPDGPYDTRDYRLFAEAVPLEGNRTFLHMGYAFSYGGASHLAMHLYLATIGHDKVGFTQEQDGAQKNYVGGMRGVVERNTMRYYLAIDAYLRSLSAPPAERLDRRLQLWFDGTEKYARQLHEVERAAYLRMKHNEVERQTASR